MRKMNILPPRVSPQKLKIQEIKLFDGYETSDAIISSTREEDNVEAAFCPKFVVFFAFVFSAALVVTLILFYHFER